MSRRLVLLFTTILFSLALAACGGGGGGGEGDTMETVQYPTFSVLGGDYTTAQIVTISTTTTGASIRYTLDGTTPDGVHGMLYSGPISVSSNTTIKAIAYKTGWADSWVTSADYWFLGTVLKASAGCDFTVAVKTDGTVWACGSNVYGQLGDNSSAHRELPVQVKGPGGSGFLTGVASVSAGYYHTVAVKADGTVWAWGSGQLGNNSTTDSFSPVQVKGPSGSGFLTGVASVSVGGSHTVAVKTDGTVWVWGSNDYGQLGINSTTITHSSSPVQVKGPGGSGFLTGVASVAAGNSHTVAVKADGTVWAWGSNFEGQLGNNSTTILRSYSPVQVKGSGGSGFLTGVASVSAGYDFTVALKTDGTVWAWGNGLLGDGRVHSEPVYSPVQVKGPGDNGFLTGVASVSAGHLHTVAVKTDGTVWAWGDNFESQLGAFTIFAISPVQVEGLEGIGFLTGVASVSAGYYHTVAVKADGKVWAWGSNDYGQLGVKSTTTPQSDTPVRALFP